MPNSAGGVRRAQDGIRCCPLHTVPDEVIHGEQGLVRCALLNDRLHTLTVDTEGAVAVCDIARGACLERRAGR